MLANKSQPHKYGIICPGFHPPELTKSFLGGLQLQRNWLLFSTQEHLPFSSVDIKAFLKRNLGNPRTAPPLIFISFSAGVVGAIGAAIDWQIRGGKVEAFFALDGLGVPLAGNFPIHRLSCDYFTHWSSALLGAGADSFYAEPAVAHLQLWRSPQTTSGWWEKRPGCRVRCTASEFLTQITCNTR